MSTAHISAQLDVFESLRRGAPAPLWVRRGIAEAWSLPDDTLVSLIVLSENVTFKVTTPEGAPVMVVRLGRPGYAASTDHIRAELQWVDALRTEVAIPTPAPVPGADGDFVQFLREDAGAVWSAVAFAFVEGTVLEDDGADPVHFTEIGRLTGLLHAHAREWAPPASFARFEWDLPDLVGAAARWGDWRDADLVAADRATLERAEARAFAALADAGVERSPRHFGLIHGDLRPSNVMRVDEGPHPLVIIDFDDCGYGYYLYDFAAALTFYEHRPVAHEMAARWLDGYDSVCPLSSQDLDAAVAFSMLRRLTMLGWATTHRADALPTDLWEENLPGTVEVAARYLDDPRWLA
ncbi:phosphotransferase enzyme family protein [Microbacterium sp. SORGH_AS_0888]|uniref:phosphotransferase enzyme family protein n=1 Tax=Microbacterium sp. SORGH_AS_0888 TaxID=3041791 RepID=UPI00278A64F9|nr:phosphotransferase [Microbacterium sp. SORGH_AS_0888]MDQ1130717.1 Ser/Thr protein kinase RdoA (MazF antagonist) [Microbacterium sp. SORGH_AS_0888]